MDLNDLWQEHKGFFLSTAIGVVLFIVAHAFISARFDSTGLERVIAKSRSDLARGGRFGEKALKTLRAHSEQVSQRLERDRKLVLFVPRPEFLVAGEQYPERRYGALTADTSRSVLELLETEGVRIDPRQGADMLGLPRTQPVEREAVQHTLIGLDLVDRALRLWVQASYRARAADRRALGLVSLDKVAIDPPPSAAGARSTRKEGPPFETPGVQIRLTCGSRTVEHFLRLVQAGEAPLQVEEFKAQLPPRGGEALDVELRLVAPQLLEGV